MKFFAFVPKHMTGVTRSIVTTALIISATPLFAQTSRFAGFTARVGTYSTADAATTWNWSPSNRADAQDAYLNIYAPNNKTPYTTTANLATMTPGLTGKEYRDAQILALNYQRYYTYGGSTKYLAREGNAFAQEYFDGIDTPEYINTTVQQALEANALMNALNQRISHGPDASWIGYSALAHAGAGSDLSLLQVDFQTKYCPPASAIEAFIVDPGARNFAEIGHRSMALGTSPTINFATVNTQSVSATNMWDNTAYWTFPPAAPAGFQGVLAAWPAANTYVPYQWFWPVNTNEAVRMSAALAGNPPVDGIVVQVTRNGTPLAVTQIRKTYVGLTWDVYIPDIKTKPTTDQVYGVKIMNVYGGKTLEYSFTVFDPNTVVSAPVTPKSPVINVATRAVVASQGHHSVPFTVQGTEPVRVVLRALGTSLSNLMAAAATNPRIDLYRESVASSNLLGTTKVWASENSWRLVQSLGLAPSTAGESAVAAILTPGTYTASLSSSTAGIIGFEVVNCDVASNSAVTNVAVATGGQLDLTVSGQSGSIQWRTNGRSIAEATNPMLSIETVTTSDAGIYECVINGTTVIPLIVGINGLTKVTGSGEEVVSNVYLPANNNTYDQVLLNGTSVAVTADDGQITRTSYIDDDNDIVQVEFSGPGTLTLVVENAVPPSPPVNYNQSVHYVKGHAGIIITGATEQTNVSVFSVGRFTAVNQTLFNGDVHYDGIADIGYISISSANGKFGGVRAANANFYSAKGYTGLYAPGVEFVGPVYLGDVNAFDSATPVILLGGDSGDTRITGGDLFQQNGAPVQVGGLTKLKFTNGTDSHGNMLPAQSNKAVLRQEGKDVTASVVVNP